MKHVPPVYPAVAQAARVEGTVIIQATISPAGKVADALVLRSDPLLDAAALDAVRQWEYTPTLLNGSAGRRRHDGDGQFPDCGESHGPADGHGAGSISTSFRG